MDTYRIVLYVTQEQENSIRNLFYDSGWSYLKASLAVSDYNPQDTQTFLEQLCRESSLPSSTDDFLELEVSQSICERKLDSSEPLHATVEPVDSLSASVLSDTGITQMSELLYPSQTCREYMPQLNIPSIPDKQLNDLDSCICDDLQLSLSSSPDGDKFGGKHLPFDKDILGNVSKPGGNKSVNALKEQRRIAIGHTFQLSLEAPPFTAHSENVEKQSQAYLDQQSRLNNNVNINEQTRCASINIDSCVDDSLKMKDNFAQISSNATKKALTYTEEMSSPKSSDEAEDVFTATARGTYECGICNTDFANIDTYHAHKKDGECKFLCPYCDKVFMKSIHSTIKAHMKCHRNEREYKCSRCNKAYNLLAQLNKHMLAHCDQKQYICDICGVSCTYLSSLKSHRQNMHSENEERQICAICGLSLKSNYNLRYHIRQVHTADRPYECPICNTRYKTKYVYETHMATHDEKSAFKCTTCTKAFKRKSLLTAHTKLHTQQFSHVCPTCDKGFHRNNKLLIHMRVHSGERPYKCDVCDYSSAIKGNLTKHLRRHDDTDGVKLETKSTDKRNSDEPIGLLNASTFDGFDVLELSNLSTGGFNSDVVKNKLTKQCITHKAVQNKHEQRSTDHYTRAKRNHTPIDRNTAGNRQCTPVDIDTKQNTTGKISRQTVDMVTSPPFARCDTLCDNQHTETESIDKQSSPVDVLNSSAFDAFDALDLSNISAVGFGTDSGHPISFTDVTFK